ncbi:MAG: type IV toxin-antitoxin system AbiEi family antitoxin [Desulfotignum sp.]|nr:type IV toxin-antitoxin system AbiEi family antitoxin [Desulfotignum sp.]MCF8137380.1 type IV toxin-antitoxin system AbiEi family antitoxin [Desulfotignum sp.]
MATLKWFRDHGGYQQLLDYYQKAPWVTKIGSGAYIQYGDSVDWRGGLYAVQKQLRLPVYVGGKTALELSGFGHNLQLGPTKTIYLFSSESVRLPTWFVKHPWEDNLCFKRLHIFQSLPDAGLMPFNAGSYEITGSAPERAMIELCTLVPGYHSFEEAGHFMESLLSLRTAKLQILLEACRSIKAKRLFLYLADTHDMPWFQKLNIKNIDLGKGKRQIAAGGSLNKKYQITVPDVNKPLSVADIP